VKRTKSKKITGLTAGQSYTFRVAAKNAVGTGTQAPPTTAVVPISPPGSMEALGDSLSAGFAACGSFASCPGASWSTGTTVNSHYQRILAVNPAISGNVFNVATPGVQVSSLAGQVNNAISHNVDYVTVLIGGNDVCRPDESQMTPVSTFQSTFHQAMLNLTSGLPNAKILVVSIPDLYRTWQIGKDNPAAVSAWNGYHFCDSMFENPTSTNSADAARRMRVRQRIIDDNAVLEDECLSFANCKYDDDALFAHQWKPSEISTVDYIHPSATGQQVIADVTSAHSYNW
jgi:lysophospholipase L1-like esterase